MAVSGSNEFYFQIKMELVKRKGRGHVAVSSRMQTSSASINFVKGEMNTHKIHWKN